MNCEHLAVSTPLERLRSSARNCFYYLDLYASLWRNSVTRELGFKANFVLWLVVEFIWFGLQLAFISVIYSHTESIGDWTKWQVVMLVGASHLIQQLFQAFLLVNCGQLTELVHTGKMDFYLLFPANTRFLVSLRHIDLGGFISAASGLAVMIYAARQLHATPTMMQVGAFLALCIAGITIHYSIMFLMATFSFWTVRAQGLIMAYYNLFSLTRVPDAAFSGAAKAFFTLFIPLLLVANVPVKVLLGTIRSPLEVVALVALSLICFFASHLLWKAALRRYSSASS
ncbi:MAG TPA: ABC-2 family transporter protein [Candidatus Angelobacter sp.]|nr:ABC-2 family transporter protein [Candidatus Angelobacter sp.]